MNFCHKIIFNLLNGHYRVMGIPIGSHFKCNIEFSRYTIRGDLLQISSETGEVTTKDELTFDYERQTQVIVQVGN